MKTETLTTKAIPTDYAASMAYEAFIRRAYSSRKSSRSGADSTLFENLQNAENGITDRWLPGLDEQRAAIKDYLLKAIKAFLNPRRERPLSAEDAAQLEALRQHIESSASTHDLKTLIQRGLELTEGYKDGLF